MPQSRAGADAAARKRRPMSEINVTPMVDVMLVLLIIFMVAAPLLTVGVPIELPRTAAAPLPSEREEPLTVALTADGGILVQNQTGEPGGVHPAPAGGGGGARRATRCFCGPTARCPTRA